MLQFKFLGYNREPYFSTEEKIEYLNEITLSKEVDGGTLYVKKTSMDGVFTYGLRSNRDYMGHGAGYVWSSRVGCLNLEFGTDFVEVVINNACFCMSATDLIKYLPEGCYFERVERFDDNEPYYNIRGYYNLSWFADNEGVNQFRVTEPIEVTDEEEINIGDFTLKSTNYEGVYVFDTLESLSTKYPHNYTPAWKKVARETNWANAPKEISDNFVEVYVDYKYGYCASKEMLKREFPDRFRYKF